MNKKFIAFGVVGILSLMIVSAMVVNYMSNEAEANVEVDYAMNVQFANIVPQESYVPSPNTNLGGSWTDSLVIDATTQLSTSNIGVKVTNNADVPIEGKYLALTVSDELKNVDCADITSLQFLDTGTQYQIDKNFQELKDLCSDKGETVVYNIPITSLAAKTVYEYPAKITFGTVEPNKYNFDAQMIITP
jgi:hypothetical protein